jgi:hypothetical protein
VYVLCTSPVVSKLTNLLLSSNSRIANHIAPILSLPSSTLYNLLELGLNAIGMKDNDALQLLATSNLDQLNVLNIAWNPTSDATEQLYRSRFGCGL